MREAVIPAVVKMIDATQATTTLVAELRVELREKRRGDR